MWQKTEAILSLSSSLQLSTVAVRNRRLALAWVSVTPVGYSDRRKGVQLEEKTNLIQNDPLTVLKPGMGLSLLVLTVAAKKLKDSVARGHVLRWHINGSHGLGVRIERVCSWHPNPIAISRCPH